MLPGDQDAGDRGGAVCAVLAAPADLQRAPGHLP